MHEPGYVTREELKPAELVRLLDRRFDGLEHALNRFVAVLGGGLFLVFVVELVILARIGL